MNLLGTPHNLAFVGALSPDTHKQADPELFMAGLKSKAGKPGAGKSAVSSGGGGEADEDFDPED